MTQYPPDRSRWKRRSELDLFSAENREAVRGVFTRGPGAVVFGWHYFFGGGSSRSVIGFSELDAYERHVERARPGDHFTLYDLDAVARQAFATSGAARSTSRTSIADAEGMDLDRRLASGVEIVAVRRFVGLLTGSTEVSVEELNCGDSDVDERRNEWTWALGELFLIDENDLHADERGGRVQGVWSPEHMRVRALIDAKRPDLEGRVPMNGPY